jgi:hypothetical protein
LNKKVWKTKLALDYEYYGLTSGIRFRTTTDRSDLKHYSRRDVDLIALEEDDKTKLWWNQNGVRDGWGDGGDFTNIRKPVKGLVSMQNATARPIEQA